MARVTILIGAQWGDEGKGKWVDYLSSDKDMVARFQGGNNAGHTLYVEGEKVVLHQLPSGIFQKGKISALLAGVVVNPVQLHAETDSVAKKTNLSPENLWISERTHVITPYHILVDGLQETDAESPIGTTKRGIGPTYRDKTDRSGLRMSHYTDEGHRKEWIQRMLRSSELFRKSWDEDPSAWEEFEGAAGRIRPFVQAAENKIRQSLRAGRSLLLEGAQGTLLDINHGTYPFVTSSSTTAGGAIASLGCNPRLVDRITGIAKAYVTRVGEGPFPTELHDETGRYLGEKGHEFGATTSRPRRCGWFDAVAMGHAVQVNGFDSIFVNKMDILAGVSELKIATAYQHPTLGLLRDFPAEASVLEACSPVYETLPGWQEDIPTEGKISQLPDAARNYLNRIEEICGVQVEMVGSGPRRNDFLSR